MSIEHGQTVSITSPRCQCTHAIKALLSSANDLYGPGTSCESADHHVLLNKLNLLVQRHLVS
jgi:hypothetical protein